ncbi:MAG: patatin-like phospholipase family protein [Prevotellaceae bacterium]|nr:patatin-like phospholipase family protein [Candidatus Faecinaster equi]
MLHSKKIGLALSGGGYRAAAYHIGTLKALYKLGILENIDVVSSISGGSITAAYYVLHKDNFKEFEISLISKLQGGVLWGTIVCLAIEVVGMLGLHAWFLSTIMDATCICLCWKVTLSIILCLICIALIVVLLHKIVPTSILIEKLYRHKFFGNKTLANLPDTPILAINATEVELNQQLTFSQLKVACGHKYPNEYFKKDEIPISLAVMASSAYPMFSPVKFPKKYLSSEDSMSPVLVDGGIYDNHGTHKLGEELSAYRTDYIVVSDACNTFMNRKGTWNVVCLMKKVIDMMMNRIEKVQRRYNEYRTNNQDQRYAYIPLTWTADENYLHRFVNNIKNKHVPLDVCMMHGISAGMVQKIENGDINAAEQAKIRVEQSIGWNELYLNKPSEEKKQIALSVGTSLCGLSKDKIEALIACAEWMTEVQLKIYFPMFVLQ